ncbi:MAG: alanine--tRNA ligase-related protein, partial [Acidobacteriota bacterium]
GFRQSQPLSLLQPTITTSFLFSVGFVDVMEAIAGNAVELDGAATVQRCFRHFDMDRVGDGRHLSFFEMGGVLRCREWRIADIVYPLIEYLVQKCNLPVERLHVTYFGGGKVGATNLPPDHQAKEAYLSAGISNDRIWPGDYSSNIWFEGANSGTERSGICGPNSEVFLELRPDSNHTGPLTTPERFIELTNIVAITHRKGSENNLEQLPSPLVELAVGMERIEMVICGLPDVYQTPKLRTLAESIVSSSPMNAFSERRYLKIAVDHIRALTHLIADGGRPGPKGRGHVMRRLFRRLLHASSTLHLDARSEFPKLARVVSDVDRAINPNLTKEMQSIIEIFDREATRMSKMPV